MIFYPILWSFTLFDLWEVIQVRRWVNIATSQQNRVYFWITRFFRIVGICSPLDSQQEREVLVVRPSWQGFSWQVILSWEFWYVIQTILMAWILHPDALCPREQVWKKKTAAGRRAGGIPIAGIKMKEKEKSVWTMRYNSLHTFIKEEGQENPA